jgi:two-component system phosphate regulon sensor histidine kinase PhoR
VEILADDTSALLKVVDNGVGIPKPEQKRVFERFYRVERDRNRERGGTGLGLAIVKHLCQAMGAHLSLDSTAGKGCTITISFPFQD